MATKHEFIDTPEGAQAAYAVLRGCSYIFLDCEGRDLGTKNGALGLLQLGTPDAARIFLIDVPALVGDASLVQIFSLLKDKNLVKVVWDGRMDDSELLFGHQVKMGGVLDLQIVDIVSRREREGNRERAYEHDRMRRMIRKELPLTAIKKLQTEGLHVLNSMDRAVMEHGLEGVPKKDASVKSLHFTSQTSVWMTRPLTPTLLEYAASDITRIASLFNHFVGKGYIPNVGASQGNPTSGSITALARLLNQSQTYIMRHRMFGRPDGKNMYVSSEFLPLGILSTSNDSSPPFASEVPSLDKSKQCKACLRVLDISCFPYDCFSATSQVVRNGIYVGDKSVPQTVRCRLCTFLDSRAAARLLAHPPTVTMLVAAPTTTFRAEAAQVVQPVQERIGKGPSTIQEVQMHDHRSLRSCSNLQTTTRGNSPVAHHHSQPVQQAKQNNGPPSNSQPCSQIHPAQEKNHELTQQQKLLKRRPSQATLAAAPTGAPPIAKLTRPSAKTNTNSPTAPPAKAPQDIPQRASTDPGTSQAVPRAARAAGNGSLHAHFTLGAQVHKAMSMRSEPTRTSAFVFDELVKSIEKKLKNASVRG